MSRTLPGEALARCSAQIGRVYRFVCRLQHFYVPVVGIESRTIGTEGMFCLCGIAVVVLRWQ
jgi:hypothetical protein